MKPPVLGAIVLYTFNDQPPLPKEWRDGQTLPVTRPAIIVRIWNAPNESASHRDSVQLQVFCDANAEGRFNDGVGPLYWATSVLQSEGPEPGKWHWPA